MDSPKARIALVGLPASGKTSVGRELAGLLGLPFVDLDEAVEAEAGKDVAAVFAAEGEAGFRARESRALAAAASGPPCVLATGGGAVLGAANRALLKGRFTAVWLRVTPRAAAARAAGQPGSRPLLAGDAEARLGRLAAEREALYAEVAAASFAAEGICPAELARDIARFIAAARKEEAP